MQTARLFKKEEGKERNILYRLVTQYIFYLVHGTDDQTTPLMDL